MPAMTNVTLNVTFFAVATVQILLDLNGKYKAKNFSMHMTATRHEEVCDDK